MLIPSVTQVISPWVDFSRIPDSVLNVASERGTRAHSACLTYAVGLPVFGAKEDVRGYYDSFRRWFDNMVDEVLLCEERLIDPDFGFSGQPDIIVLSKSGEMMLVDLKTPLAKSKSWKVQLAAYGHLSERGGIIYLNRGGSLRLSPDGGTPTMDWYEGSKAQDMNIFLSCLNAYRFFNS